MHSITVTVTVEIDGESDTKTADASTETNPYLVADGMVGSLAESVRGPLGLAGRFDREWPAGS